MEWFANMPWQWVIVIVAVLLAIRFALKRVKGKWAKSIAELAESLALALALVFLVIRPFLVQAYFIPSPSMEPGLLVHDHLLANKLVYRLRPPRFGEIVVFKSPPALEADEGKKDFIKRVIGVPGDTIEVRQGLVVVNEMSYDHTQILDWFGDHQSRLKLYRDHIVVDGERITRKEIAEMVGASASDVRIEPGVVLRNGKPLDERYTAEDPNYDYARVEVPAGKFFVMGDNRNNSKDSHIWGYLPRKYAEGKAMFIFWPLNRIRLID